MLSKFSWTSWHLAIYCYKSHISFLDHFVADLFMHSLAGIVLLYLAAPFYTKDVLHEISSLIQGLISYM